MRQSLHTLALCAAALCAASCASKPLPETPGVELTQATTEASGQVAFTPAVCTGIDLAPDDTKRDETALLDFLRAQHVDATPVRERSDLIYVDVRAGGAPVRLRVAILPTAAAAAEELHRAIRERGNGAWGVHRSNLAVLAPAGSDSNILAFAVRTKLACWGVLTVYDGEARVIPGGYREL